MKNNYLTVKELKKFIDENNLSDDTKIVIMENDAEASATSVNAIGYNEKIYYDQFEGLRKCNIGGYVYNDYERESAIVLGFSYNLSFEDAFSSTPTSGCHIKNIIIDKELPKDEK